MFTAGDVQAVLNGFTTGGRVILAHGQAVEGAPADGMPGSSVAIRPFNPWDGHHYCADDWHVILVAEFDGGDHSYERDTAVAALSPIQITFTLDNVQLSTTRTPFKRFLNPGVFGWAVAYGFQEGHIFSPTDLAVGGHLLSFVSADPVYGTFARSIKFYIDAAGTGACV